MLNYITVTETREKWGMGSPKVALYCVSERINSAEKIDNMRLIIKDAKSLNKVGVKR